MGGGGRGKIKKYEAKQIKPNVSSMNDLFRQREFVYEYKKEAY